ncbi:hypothetical protein D9M73_295860 [compost metagenome]
MLELFDGARIQHDRVIAQLQSFQSVQGTDAFWKTCQVATSGAEFAKVREGFEQAVRLAGKARVGEFQNRDLVEKLLQLRRAF